ncbi:DUF5318 family protein [Corynebacterium lujinxingii]|uniref:DUF5318 family protein n=1 Tax=Corynebacterium lujinxingii TaxID=2763010 RepID=A0A7H0JYP5_9CORY|nr:DUF5318 family protein [Corynebacterium lujinxingii]MBC3179714.1 DUF5318 family protein [Corynebacterium lujinxingii]NNO11642.1 hypothetical protein [Corynebacterium lujinxingii]QNP90161.1 DUF5318 family protein [Corynebacterium lujinxingii]
MFVYQGEVSHEWRRRHAIRELKAGRLLYDDVCDADFILRTAAEHHGIDAERDCPVCGEALREVKWVYSEKLGRRTGTARSADEIDRMVQEVGPVTVHFVEVCHSCKWNHLLKEVTAVPVV